MTEDVFSFDDFLSKSGGKKPSTNSIKEKFLEEVEQESVEILKESHRQEEKRKEEEFQIPISPLLIFNTHKSHAKVTLSKLPKTYVSTPSGGQK